MRLQYPSGRGFGKDGFAKVGSDVVERVRVAADGEIPPGGNRVVDVRGTPVAVFFTDGQYYAIDDRCPHAGAPLSDGCVEGGIVTCAWHAWQFHLSDGAWAGNPRIKTRTYRVAVEAGDVFIVLDT
ncbi:MAG TPA: non-heme iron oxygenase ferredoxin subunit [Fimbriiglobus sp.]|jgi:nitrite reductase (NADH) small subunit/3-phenylpropionate/trans-cinnamate dioxygenase ferredoxin subunit